MSADAILSTVVSSFQMKMRLIAFIFVLASVAALSATNQSATTKPRHIEKSSAVTEIHALKNHEEQSQHRLAQENHFTDRSSTITRCSSRQYKCNIMEKINSPDFATELFHKENPPPVPKEEVDVSIDFVAASVIGATELFLGAQALCDMTKNMPNRLLRAKSMEAEARQERWAEKMKADAQVIASFLVSGGNPEEQGALMDKMTKAVFASWMKAQDVQFPVDDALALLEEIDPTKLPNEILEMARAKNFIEDLRTLQKRKIMIDHHLKIETDEDNRQLLEQMIVTTLEEIKLKAVKLVHALLRMTDGRSVNEIKEKLAILSEAVDVC